MGTPARVRREIKRLKRASNDTGRTVPGLQVIGSWEPVTRKPPEPATVAADALRLTVCEIVAHCFVCTRPLEKGRPANLYDGRKLLHVGRCSAIVRELLEKAPPPSGEASSARQGVAALRPPATLTRSANNPRRGGPSGWVACVIGGGRRG